MIAFNHNSYAHPSHRAPHTLRTPTEGASKHSVIDPEREAIRQSVAREKGKVRKRPCTVNQKFTAQQNSNSKPSLYRKINHRHPLSKFLKQGTRTHEGVQQMEGRESPFKRYNGQPQKQVVKRMDVQIDHDQLCMVLQWPKGSATKGSSFEQFLENKRKKEALRRREEFYNLRGPKLNNNLLEKQGFNLSGKGVNEARAKVFLKLGSALKGCATQPSSREKQLQREKSKLYTIEPEEVGKQSYIKYVFKQEEGYCFFHKYLHSPIDSHQRKMPYHPHTKKKTSLSIQKEKKQDVKVFQRSKRAKVDSGKIQGWAISSTHEGSCD